MARSAKPPTVSAREDSKVLGEVGPFKPASPPAKAALAVQARPLTAPTAADVPATESAPADSGASDETASARGAETLVEDKPASPEEEKTQDKLDAASPAPPGGSDAAEPAGPDEPAGPAETGPAAGVEAGLGEQLPPEAVAEPPASGSAGGAAMAVAPPMDDDSVAAASRQAAQVERIEQADREQAAEQQAAEREEEHAEAQPVAAQAEAAPANGGESIELSPQEKAAGLASVGEDVDGDGAVAGDAGGGGGGGGAAPPPEPEAPDTGAMTPESGLAAAASLPVGAAAKALGGVGAAVDSSVQGEGERLQGEMPELEVGGEAGDAADGPMANAGGARRVTRAPAATARPSVQPKPLPEPPPSPVRNIPAPRLAPAADGALSAADAQRVQASIQSLPTNDPGLDMPAGPPPALQLSGDADPAQVADQRERLNASIAEQRAHGAADVAAPAGENNIRVRRPRETLRARPLAVPAGATGGTMEGTDEAVAIIAEQKKGDEVRAAIGQASADVAAKRAEHQAKVSEEQSRTRQQLDELRTENASQQSDARRQARAEVAKARADWSEEQRQEVAKADDKTQAEIAKGNESIGREQKQADEQAAQHIADGEQQAQRHKRDAETEASAKKRDAENESQGVFGWLASKVSAFFDKLKQGLTAIFDAAKRLVRAAIEQAKKLAVAVIEKARAAVVSIIRAVGDALIAIGDFLLAAFPGLRAKWRAFIEAKVKAAQERVNQLADALKRGAQKLFDLLGKGLEGLLDLYRKGMLAALDAAKAAAKGAIKFAQNVAETLGAFVAIVKDVARNPGQWLSNLGAAIKDGIRNHLWKAFSGAVKTWFNEKIDEVVGIGSLIWNVLKKGGLGLKEIGAMVWEGLKKAIPTALIGLLIEKLVAMIVPAAGAVMVVIEGLKAAWGSIQRIISAISKFVEFLKAVKSGGAGPQFASMVAAAAVVVIDFVANWLLRKLRGPGTKVGGKIKAIAQKIMAKIKAAAKKVMRWVKGKFKGLAAKFKGWKKKFDDWRQKRKDKKGKDKGKNKEQEKVERLNKAIAFVTPRVQAMLNRGTHRVWLVSKLLFWRLRFRIRVLRVVQNGESVHVEAANSPTRITNQWFKKNHKEIYQLIKKIAQERYRGKDVVAQPEIADHFDRAAPGETLTGRFGGHGRALVRAEEGERGDLLFGKLAGKTVRGESYGPLASRVHGTGLSGAAVGEDMMSALRGGKVSPDIADLTALTFGAEVSRSRKHGGVSEVTSRLALAGLREGRLNAEEAFGTAEANSAHEKAKRELKKLRESNAGKDLLAKARAEEKAQSLGTGGLVPETMRGYSTARKPADRLTSPGAKPPRENTFSRQQAEESVNRTVELVYRAVGDNDYSNLSDLERDIRKTLERVDRYIKP